MPYIMLEEDIEHYRQAGKKMADELVEQHKDELGDAVFALSNVIKGEYEHYSDRWNPAKLAKVEAMHTVLVETLEKYWEDMDE